VGSFLGLSTTVLIFIFYRACIKDSQNTWTKIKIRANYWHSILEVEATGPTCKDWIESKRFALGLLHAKT
jgi:hypothetical protein